MTCRAVLARTPDHVWLDFLQPTGLVVSKLVLGELGLVAPPQDASDTALAAGLADAPDTLFIGVLGWPSARVAGAWGDLPLPPELGFALVDQDTLLEPTFAVQAAGGEGWQLLVRIEDEGVGLDTRGALPGWEATPHQRFERLLRESGVGAGVLVGDAKAGRVLRLVTAPRAETSGWIEWPLGPLGTVAGRAMLGGLNLMLGTPALFTGPAPARLPQLLSASRQRQAAVSTQLAGQGLAALHTLLRGLSDAEPALVRDLAGTRPHHLYEGLLSVLLRLVFILYAEDRDLMPSHPADGGRQLYEEGYSLRGLLARLDDDAALNPDTMDERRGAWGRLLALFKLVHGGYDRFMQGRGGVLFAPSAFPFLMGNANASDPERVPLVSDGCIHRVLRSLMMVGGERLSYRTLDVEQIGSVYETVMGFAAQLTTGQSLAIRAGKKDRTPVFVDLDALVAVAGGERLKMLKETTERGKFPARATAAIRDASTAIEMEVALAPVCDERGSPQARSVPAGTPILQPTDERRRTGSHYTPRELTEPIVRHALEPAFARIGAAATPDDVLALKVCDPAMGSGAFLVEACRQLGARLVAAWEARPDLKPTIPPDEDEDLHARRLVAQRCLYGVDKNAMAVDLAKLSLWLATLARDHEFSFLDHALKCGDSLVGLTRAQISGATYATAPAPTLWGLQVKQLVERGLAHRDAIRTAPDDVALAMQEARHVEAERDLANVRLIGDAAVAAFFAHDKSKVRLKAVAELADRAGSADWEFLRQRALSLAGGTQPIRPFHWEVEFPEVFARDDPGFDAIVGNPPFLGVTSLGAFNNGRYSEWLREQHEGVAGKTDLSAYFFRRAFELLCAPASMGLIATKTIAQGDTRKSGLSAIIGAGGKIARVTRRFRWPGEADVTVTLMHIDRQFDRSPVLDDEPVENISSYLWNDRYESEPFRLLANADMAFLGAKIQDSPFSLTLEQIHVFSEPLATKAASVVRWALGADQTFNRSKPEPERAVFDFRGYTPTQVADTFPDVWSMFEQHFAAGHVFREADLRWSHPAKDLFSRLPPTGDFFAISSGGATHHVIATISRAWIPTHKLVVFTVQGKALFSVLQSSVHELWAGAFSTTFGGGDASTYNPTQTCNTFPFPPGFDTAPALEAAGQAYHDHRAQLMIARGQGMTPTYNRFHRADDADEDIATLRTLHAAMDDAVLRAYGWDDLADTAAPVFLDEAIEDDHKYQKRLFWPAAMRDAVLARLLRLNEDRARQEREDAAAARAMRRGD